MRGIRPAMWIPLGALFLAGCFRFVPSMQGPVPAGTQVEVELTDRGRVSLAPQLGEAAVLVAGEVAEASDSLLVLRVARTRYLRGSSVVWSGESVGIASSGIARVRVRAFSSRRTTAAVAGAVGMLAVVAPHLRIIGGGSGRPETGACPESCTSVR